MSLWKFLGEVAYSLEKAEATGRKNKEERRKQRLEELKYTFANLVTLKAFHNRMNTLVSGIDQLFAVTGELIVQRVTDRFAKTTAQYTSDLGGVLNLKMDDVVDRIKDFIARGEPLFQLRLEGALGAILKGHDRLNEHRAAVLSDQVRANDIHLTELKVEMIQRFQDVEAKAETRSDVLLGMMQALFDKVEEVKNASPEPSLAWLAENSNELIVYGEAMKNLREGTIPASAAMVHAVKAVRNLIDVDMKTAKAALDIQAELWGVGEIELAQAA